MYRKIKRDHLTTVFKGDRILTRRQANKFLKSKKKSDKHIMPTFTIIANNKPLSYAITSLDIEAPNQSHISVTPMKPPDNLWNRVGLSY